MNAAGDTSIKILEEEKRKVAKDWERLAKMTTDIEKVLIDNNATWKDWNNIVTSFNNRNDDVMPNLSIAFIKQRFDAKQL